MIGIDENQWIVDGKLVECWLARVEQVENGYQVGKKPMKSLFGKVTILTRNLAKGVS